MDLDQDRECDWLSGLLSLGPRAAGQWGGAPRRALPGAGGGPPLAVE